MLYDKQHGTQTSSAHSFHQSFMSDIRAAKTTVAARKGIEPSYKKHARTPAGQAKAKPLTEEQKIAKREKAKAARKRKREDENLQKLSDGTMPLDDPLVKQELESDCEQIDSNSTAQSASQAASATATPVPGEQSDLAGMAVEALDEAIRTGLMDAAERAEAARSPKVPETGSASGQDTASTGTTPSKQHTIKGSTEAGPSTSKVAAPAGLADYEMLKTRYDMAQLHYVVCRANGDEQKLADARRRLEAAGQAKREVEMIRFEQEREAERVRRSGGLEG